MAISALLVTTTTRWIGTGRAPRALTRAGFDVALLAPRGSLPEHSRYVGKIGHVPDQATPVQWIYAFAAMVKATQPRLVVPGDDTAFRLLNAMATSPPQDMQPALALQLASLIRQSLGEPAHYRTSIDKTALPPAAQSLGLRVPPFAIVTAQADAERFAATHGYPLVLKRNFSSASDGVAICAGPADVAPALAALTGAARRDFDPQGGERLLAQAHIAGASRYYPAMAWQGTLLAGYAAEKLEPGPGDSGIPTVQRYHHDASLRAVAAALARGFGISGFFSPEFIVDEKTGDAYLIEINRRLVGGAHRGSPIGVDHWAALHAALQGIPSPTRDDLDPEESHVAVHFPQEWLRDPDSRWLRDYPADVPWDDPKLLEALIALRHES
jgi:predicted ATP-grasp superfamily ATP-dependent carboligase